MNDKEHINIYESLNRAYGYREAIIDVIKLTIERIDIDLAEKISLLPAQKYPMEEVGIEE